MASEQERLETMYGEMEDGHLRDLAQDRENLTLDGQIALQKVLERRGLAPKHSERAESGAVRAIAPGDELEEGFTPGIPGFFPSTAGQMERALEPSGGRKAGMVDLVSFFDGHELSKACEALEAAGIDLALEPEDRDSLEGAPPSFKVWVDEGERAHAESVLRQKMGLFPLGELDGEPTDSAGMVTLGEFDTEAEAERVAAMLGEQGLACRLDKQMSDGDDLPSHTVEVRAEDRDRALAIAAAALGIR
jgi:hypothetical protein